MEDSFEMLNEDRAVDVTSHMIPRDVFSKEYSGSRKLSKLSKHSVQNVLCRHTNTIKENVKSRENLVEDREKMTKGAVKLINEPGRRV